MMASSVSRKYQQHHAPVKQLQSQINPERVPPPKALYGLGGYKVWIGNICIDDEGKRLLSDGRDDVVVVHDFSSKDDDK
jgi:hypothetical protein